MADKTVKVKVIVAWGNTQLAMLGDGQYVTMGFKSGICAMIEKVLREAGAYNGYYHLDYDDCERDTFGDYSRKYFIK